MSAVMKKDKHIPTRLRVQQADANNSSAIIIEITLLNLTQE